MGKLENELNSYVTDLLEEKSLEDILEDHDLTPQECIEILFKGGHIDLPEFIEASEED